MSEITVETIVLLVSFVLPGYLTILVSKALYQPDKPLSDLEITYKCLLYSTFMYIGVYLCLTGAGLQFEVKTLVEQFTPFILAHPFFSLGVILFLSALIGAFIARASSAGFVYQIFKSLGFTGWVQPPNIYAALLDPEFEPKAANGYWVQFTKNEITFEGYAAYTDIKNSDKIIYLTSVRELEGKIVKKIYAEEYGMIVDITKLDGFSIFYD